MFPLCTQPAEPKRLALPPQALVRRSIHPQFSLRHEHSSSYLKAVHSPFQQLPPEIIAMIFQYLGNTRNQFSFARSHEQPLQNMLHLFSSNQLRISLNKAEYQLACLDTGILRQFVKVMWNLVSRRSRRCLGFLAAERGHTEVMRLYLEVMPLGLLEHRLLRTDSHGRGMIWHAVKGGHEGLVKVLLEHGKSRGCNQHALQLHGRWDGCPLFLALEAGNIRMAEMLLNHGAPRKTLNVTLNLRPIHLAAKRGYLTIAQSILESGSFDSMATSEGTPLHFAAANGHTEMCALLLQYQTSFMDLQDKRGQTPLMLAAEHGYDSTTQLLASRASEACVRMIDHRHRSALWYASLKGFVETVECLIAKGAPVNFPGRKGALSDALSRGDLSMAELLYRHGASHNGDKSARRWISIRRWEAERQQKQLKKLEAMGKCCNGSDLFRAKRKSRRLAGKLPEYWGV